MYKKLFALLVTAMIVIGCNSSSTEEIKMVLESLGSEQNITTDANGLTKEVKIDVLGTVNIDGTKAKTASLTIPEGQKLRDANGQDACTEDNPCSITAEQKCAKEVSDCSKTEWRNLVSSVPDVGADQVVLYAGTLDITEGSGVLTNCGMQVTIEVPYCGYIEGGPRENNLYGIPNCATMKVWVTDACGNDGKWVTATVSTNCGADQRRTITITVDSLPAHIVMFVPMDKDSDYFSGASW
ncbi:MAG: hypothetical protein GXO30_05430 [Epsilonproteobacteria bacterium]|nr:hypothetical protein [Campylobacterota bacterium]